MDEYLFPRLKRKMTRGRMDQNEYFSGRTLINSANTESEISARRDCIAVITRVTYKRIINDGLDIY